MTFKAVLVPPKQIRETVDLSGGNSALDVFKAIFPAYGVAATPKYVKVLKAATSGGQPQGPAEGIYAIAAFPDFTNPAGIQGEWVLQFSFDATDARTSTTGSSWTQSVTVSATTRTHSNPVETVMTHPGRASNTSTDSMYGNHGVKDIFLVDEIAQGVLSADNLYDFEDGQDRIKFKNSVSAIWITKQGDETFIRSTADGTATHNYLASLWKFTGTLDKNDSVDTSILINPVIQAGTASKDSFTAGTDGTIDIFTVDTNAGDRVSADVITGFKDGEDRVKIAANDGDVAANGGKVSWKAVTDTADGTKKDIIIYAGDIEDVNKILAVIEDFDGTFDADDFATLSGVTFAEIQ